MSALKITEQVYSSFVQKGYVARIVSIDHLTDLAKEMDERYSHGLFDNTFYKERLNYFVYRKPQGISNLQSIIITSAPQPQKIVTFHKDGKAYPLVIPPTYSADTDSKVKQVLSDTLGQEGYQLYSALLPQKLLAARSGLVTYGRNNITYTETAGSFHRLNVFLSDLPVTEDIWIESQLMELCYQCTACIKKCPTGAISSDRFLLRAEKCLTFHNERNAEFPDWIDSTWHNCLIGCMECQLCCPVNKEFFQWYEQSEQFTSKETESILRGVPRNQLPDSVIKKLENIYLLDDMELIPRNLSVLLSRYR
ncbi:MAG: 4Fe-4S double cluster binding domain-containing protein [Candidatus Hermodarchaeota archaeon]